MIKFGVEGDFYHPNCIGCILSSLKIEYSVSQFPTHNLKYITQGLPTHKAKQAMILLHGRGGSPEKILRLPKQIGASEFALFALEAQENTWYPHHFLEEKEINEPGISSGIAVIGEMIDQIEAEGILAENIHLAGFSQGACMIAEFAIEHPRKLGGLYLFTGALAGPSGTRWELDGSLASTPVFISCGDNDPFIPLWRVEETADVLEKIGGKVYKHVFPDKKHVIVRKELEIVRGMIEGRYTASFF